MVGYCLLYCVNTIDVPLVLVWLGQTMQVSGTKLLTKGLLCVQESHEILLPSSGLFSLQVLWLEIG